MTTKVFQEKLQPVASNLSPEELLSLVRHAYPNMQGPLASMADKFGGLIDEADILRRQLCQYQELKDQPVITLIEEGKPHYIELKCQHCGCDIEVELS